MWETVAWREQYGNYTVVQNCLNVCVVFISRHIHSTSGWGIASFNVLLQVCTVLWWVETIATRHQQNSLGRLRGNLQLVQRSVHEWSKVCFFAWWFWYTLNNGCIKQDANQVSKVCTGVNWYILKWIFFFYYGMISFVMFVYIGWIPDHYRDL